MTDTYCITVRDIDVDVVRKDIKNLHLAVYPPAGRVRIAVPLHVDDDAVRRAVIAKLGWIRQQQAQYRAQKRQTEREYVSGESHYFQGVRYLLNVVYQDAPPQVQIRNKKYIELTVRPGSDTRKRGQVLDAWYRDHLKQQTPLLIEKWESRLGVSVAEWRVKQMKTKWGTCNIEARRIWLNLELAKKPLRCLEYIVVHEMTHLLERHHNEHFVYLMDQSLPGWRHLKDELNSGMLAYEEWDY